MTPGRNAAAGLVATRDGALVPTGNSLPFRLRLREAAGITGRDAAASVGIHQADWSDLETGKNPNPTVATLKKIAAALGVTLAELFLDEDGESVTLE